MGKESATATLKRLRAGWSKGGRAKTDAQNAARRQNATRAGRPGRVCIYCRAPVLGGHVNRALDSSCGAHGWRWSQRGDEARPTVTPDPQLLAHVLAHLSRDPLAPVSFADARRQRRLTRRLRALVDALA